MTAPARIGRLIGAVVTLLLRRPLVTVLAVLGLTAASFLYTAGNLGINTDTADMISPDLDWRRDFIAYRDSFPARDRNIVAVVDGPSPEASASFARELAERLRTEPELFPSVFLAGDGDFFERNGLLYLQLDELDRLASRLIDAQPVLGRLAGNVSGAGILEVLFEALVSEEPLPAAAVQDLDRIFAETAATLAAANEGRRRPILWGSLLGVDTAQSERQLVLVRPALDFSRIRPAREAIERIHEIGAELEASRSEAVTLRLTGTLAMEHEELSSITQSASTAGFAALVMVMIVLFWALRSLRLLVIAVITLLSGLILTAAFAALTVGHLNLLSVAFAVLYIGLGVDFILHLSLRLKELGASGLALEPALLETASGVGSSLVICAVTTAVGFFAFIPTDFDGISELGLISGGGMLISLCVSLSLLPALICLFWRADASPPAGGQRRRWQRGLGALPPRATLAAAAGVALVALAVLPDLDFDGNPINLRDPSAESIRALEDLAADSQAPLFDLAVLVPDAASAAATAEALAPLASVASVRTVASLVPANQPEKLFVLEDLDLVLGSTLDDFAPAPADPARLTAALERLAETLAAAPARTPAQAEWLAAAAVRLDAIDRLPASAARNAALALDEDIRGNLLEQIERLERALEARVFDREDLPAALAERWVNAAGQELVEVVPAEDLNDAAAAARFVAEVRSVAPNATGLPVVYEEAAATVTRAFSLALVYAFAAVSLVLLLFLRSWRDTLLVLGPIVFAAVVTAGTAALFGLPLNFANIIALPLLVGVGVDSGIHMVHRMRTEPPRDGDPLRTSTSRAVFASAVTTIASFGNLAFSTHLGMASMGQLLTLGMLISLVAVLVVLPAMMRLGRQS